MRLLSGLLLLPRALGRRLAGTIEPLLVLNLAARAGHWLGIGIDRLSDARQRISVGIDQGLASKIFR